MLRARTMDDNIPVYREILVHGYFLRHRATMDSINQSRASKL